MISPQVIEEIRKQADIVQVISSYIDVKKKGNQYGKGKQKAIQPKSAYSHSSGRHGRGVDRHLCK